MMKQIMIEIKNLKKTYSNKVKALKGININIEKGKFFGLLGPNGAGKTTTIGILTGLVNLDEGEVNVSGYDVLRDYKHTRKLIGLSPQEINLDVFFTIRELLVGLDETPGRFTSFLDLFLINKD